MTWAMHIAVVIVWLFVVFAGERWLTMSVFIDGIGGYLYIDL